jgi:hypothetical protein
MSRPSSISISGKLNAKRRRLFAPELKPTFSWATYQLLLKRQRVLKK